MPSDGSWGIAPIARIFNGVRPLKRSFVSARQKNRSAKPEIFPSRPVRRAFSTAKSVQCREQTTSQSMNHVIAIYLYWKQRFFPRKSLRCFSRSQLRHSLMSLQYCRFKRCHRLFRNIFTFHLDLQFTA